MSSTQRTSHEFELYKPQAYLDIRKNSLTVRIIDKWNRLHEIVLHRSKQPPRQPPSLTNIPWYLFHFHRRFCPNLTDRQTDRRMDLSRITL